MTQSQSRVAIVTGASRGIGAAIAERLASDGYAVLVNYSGSAAPAEELVAKIVRSGGKARGYRADVGDPQAVTALFDEAESALGRVDVLVNNAGIMPLGRIADVDDATFERVLSVNLKGSFYAMREAARRLNDGGRIVNVSSSIVGLFPPTYGAYAATKAAVEALTHILAKELGERNIRVNAIAPGPTATELFVQGKSAELIKQIASQNPLGRLGTPADIANAVAFLANEQSGWIDGQVVRANGGMI